MRNCIEAAEAVETIQARAEEPANAAIEAAIERLAALSDNDYELVREDEAEKLGFRPTFLDKVVKKTKAANAGAALDPSAAKLAKHFSPVEPWPEAVDGGALLLELVKAIRAHVVMEENAAIAVALWILHAHAHDAAAISPILAIISPQKRCGKTTLLSLLQELTPIRSQHRTSRPLLFSAPSRNGARRSSWMKPIHSSRRTANCAASSIAGTAGIPPLSCASSARSSRR